MIMSTRSDLTMLAADMRREDELEPDPAETQSGMPLVLALDDLLQDANGEIVLYNDSHLPSLALSTTANTVSRGNADFHVTAAGEDVTGYHFVAFDNGKTIYFQDGLDLIITSDG